MRSLPAAALSLGLALSWNWTAEFMAKVGLLTGEAKRKVIHIGTGPFFIISWLLFDEDPADPWIDWAPFLAAAVPGLLTLKYLLIGLGIVQDQRTVDAVTRKGNPRELLAGPVQYGVIFVSATALFWKSSLVGFAALMTLCMGDGFAGLLGEWGSRRRLPAFLGPLPWNPKKSGLGTFSFVIFSLLAIYTGGQFFAGRPGWWPRAAIIDNAFLIAFSVCCSALVESMACSGHNDNIFLSITTAVLMMWSTS